MITKRSAGKTARKWILIFSLALSIPICRAQVGHEERVQSRSADDTLITINEGSGSFPLQRGHKGTTIRVHYHKPRNYRSQSPILIVLPGAGRND